MAAAVRESMTVPGGRVARAFVGGVLGPGHPCGDVAALVADFGDLVFNGQSFVYGVAELPVTW